jgi:DNA-binding SARP family transcriptional activator
VLLRALALTLVLACSSAALPALASGPAPADEYFGPFKESVLEIRNRLMAFERDANWHLRREIRGIDNLEMTIEDWYRKYPRDPWIPGFAKRLTRVYARAHDQRDARCVRAGRMARLAGI